MKTAKFVCGLLFGAVAVVAGAATNDLTSTLQQGLFEEEANHNFPAAIQAYQSVASQFDKDRKLAATAIFRLGECYRKQGDTNAANAQYERILRDFSEQTALVNLSRTYLAGSGRPAPVAAAPAAANEARSQAAGLKTQLDYFSKLKGDELRIAVQQASNNDVLNIMMRNWDDAKVELAKARNEFGPDHSQVRAATTRVEVLTQQIDVQVKVFLDGLREKYAALLAEAGSTTTPSPALSNAARQQQKKLVDEEIGLLEKKLQAQQKQIEAGRLEPDALWATQREILELKRQAVALAEAPVQAQTTAAPETTSEAEEVRRIQAMIKDSPDLINAPDTTEEQATPLYRAAEAGQLQVARFLVANGADVSKGTRTFKTPLHAAAAAGHKAMVEFLLAHKANPDATSSSGTPLVIAARNGFRSIAEVLLAAHADVNGTDGSGRTALYEAAQKGFKSVAELLLAHGADPNVSARDQASPLFAAVSDQQLELVKLLLTNKANVNLARSDGMAPLHEAARRGAVSIMELLLANKADVNVRDHRGETPLHLGADTGNAGTINLLLENGAEVNARTSPETGATPLVNAILAKKPAAIGTLVAHKADLNLTFNVNLTPSSYYGVHPLLIAYLVNSGDLDTLELLLKNGADPDARNGRNNYEPTVLHYAARGNAPVVKLLLAYKADPNAKTSQEATPLYNAIDANSLEIVKLLLDGGADPNERTGMPSGGAVSPGFWKTPLHVAVYKQQLGIIQALLSHKADPNGRDVSGRTPLFDAVNTGNEEITKLLLANGADVNARDNEGKTPLLIVEANAPQYVGLAPGATPVSTYARPIRSLRLPSGQVNTSEIMRKLLLEHGAVENLPDFSAIRVMRKGGGLPTVVFQADTNGFNHFTLMEVLEKCYPDPTRFTFSFPDLAHIKVHRPIPDKSAEETVTEVNLLTGTGGFNCAKNLPLEFGDVVEIPERPHTLAEQAPGSGGLSPTQVNDLTRCVERKLRFVVKDKTVEIVAHGSEQCYLAKALTFREVQQILLSTSDFSRVQVKRQRPGPPGAILENVQEVWNNQTPGYNDLWLRDGDVIEVPDKG